MRKTSDDATEGQSVSAGTETTLTLEIDSGVNKSRNLRRRSGDPNIIITMSIKTHLFNG